MSLSSWFPPMFGSLSERTQQATTSHDRSRSAASMTQESSILDDDSDSLDQDLGGVAIDDTPKLTRQQSHGARHIHSQAFSALDAAQSLSELSASDCETLPREVEDRNQVLEAKTNGKKALKENLEEDAKALQKENDALKMSVTKMRAKYQDHLDECNAKKNRLRDEAVQTNAELHKMHASLEKCKTQIFNMQPLEHMTDSELASQYNDLSETIGDFAEVQFGDSDNPLEKLSSFISSRRVYDKVQTYLVQDGHVELIKKFPCAGVSFVRYLLARYSYVAALEEKKHYPGLELEIEYFLAFVEWEMSSGKVQRDQSFIDKWKAEIQRALPSSSHLATRHQKYLSEQATSLSDMLACLIPEEASPTPVYENCSSIILEAAKLAHNIRKSPASYAFEPPFSPATNPRERVLWVDDLGLYRLINVKTGSEIHKPGMVDVDQDGRAGEKLCVVHPSLIRRGRNGKADVTLVKAMLLVKLDRPLLRKSKTGH